VWEASGRGLSEVRASFLLVLCFHVGSYFTQLEASPAVKKVQVDAVMAATQTALATTEYFLQTLLTGLTSSSALSSDGGGYMGQIADGRPRLAEAAAKEELARVKFDMSRREIGELEERWKAVEREGSQGERDVKEMQAEVESLRKKAAGRDGAQKRSRRVRRRCGEQRKMGRAVHGCVFALSFTRSFLFNN